MMTGFHCLFVLAVQVLVVSSQCADKPRHAANCPKWKGHCGTGQWANFMKENCPATCGQCPKSTCEDLKPSCMEWKRAGYCASNSKYYQFMRKNCKKTCGFCATPPQPVVSVSCKEDSPQYEQHCGTWALSGNCKNNYKKFMEDHCFKTCNFKCTKTGKQVTDCWTACNTKAGYCKACGTGKACCRRGWKADPAECKDATIPCSGFHCCSTPKKDSKSKKGPECGRRKPSKGRVVDGVDAAPNSWPWQVGFYYYDSFFCGGSLISDRYIITAAHCMTGRSEDGMTVRLGDHVRNTKDGTEQEIEVEKYIVHSGYDRKTIENDIAIVKLKSAAKLNPNVAIVCLPEKNSVVDLKSTCYITGWGKTKGGGRSANILQEAKLPLVSNEECGKKNVDMWGNSKVTDVMICAGYSDGRKVSGCHGDSGGPFVCKTSNNRWVLQGAVSWGSPSCDATHRYTVFARLSKYIEWIKQSMD